MAKKVKIWVGLVLIKLGITPPQTFMPQPAQTGSPRALFTPFVQALESKPLKNTSNV
jgi:hypothetical protein